MRSQSRLKSNLSATSITYWDPGSFLSHSRIDPFPKPNSFSKAFIDVPFSLHLTFILSTIDINPP